MSARVWPWGLAELGKLAFRRVREKPLPPWLFMLPHDIGLFLKSAGTDAKIAQVRKHGGSRAAFEAAYTDSDDPWASASARYRYQRLKYDKLIALLPQRRFVRALDLGCGLGLLSQKLALRADNVVGMDIAAAVIDHARLRGAAIDNLEFERGDLLDLPSSLDGTFDLVVIADVLYYLSPLDETVLKAIILRIATLLTPGGICLLANHFFFSADPDSRMSRNIHRAFSASPRFSTMSEHRRAFFLVSVLSEKALLALT